MSFWYNLICLLSSVHIQWRIITSWPLLVTHTHVKWLLSVDDDSAYIARERMICRISHSLGLSVVCEVSSDFSFEHSSDRNGFVRPCASGLLLRTNDFLSHTYDEPDFSSECISRWAFRLLLWVNELLHTSHRYGLSPVCVRWCLVRLHFWVNDLSHTSHE